MGSAIYQTSVYNCESWEVRRTSSYSASTYSSSTGSSSTWYSSTTYTGQFGVHSLTTTLSNYESVVSTSSSGSNTVELIGAIGADTPHVMYTEFAGSGFTTYP